MNRAPPIGLQIRQACPAPRPVQSPTPMQGHFAQVPSTSEKGAESAWLKHFLVIGPLIAVPLPTPTKKMRYAIVTVLMAILSATALCVKCVLAPPVLTVPILILGRHALLLSPDRSSVVSLLLSTAPHHTPCAKMVCAISHVHLERIGTVLGPSARTSVHALLGIRILAVHATP